MYCSWWFVSKKNVTILSVIGVRTRSYPQQSLDDVCCNYSSLPCLPTCPSTIPTSIIIIFTTTIGTSTGWWVMITYLFLQNAHWPPKLLTSFLTITFGWMTMTSLWRYWNVHLFSGQQDIEGQPDNVPKYCDNMFLYYWSTLIVDITINYYEHVTSLCLCLRSLNPWNGHVLSPI